MKTYKSTLEDEDDLKGTRISQIESTIEEFDKLE